MTRSKARGIHLGGLLALALGAIALLAMPGVAAAKMKDRNHDHIPDKWEKRHHLSLQVKQTYRDQDGDHLNNLGEWEAGDNPHNADTNHNGIEDGEENAGTIASFDKETGKLTIALFGGETITGLVTEETEIECGCNHGAEEEGAVTSSDQQGGEGQQGEDGPDEGEMGGPSGQGAEEEGGDGPNHESGDDGSDQGSQSSSSCSTEDLVVGTTVKEAELQVGNGVATFSKIELGKSEG
ncbi:MAG TPA: hypothetical protein VF731_07815 [Solirubrobacterales bacterium]